MARSALHVSRSLVLPAQVALHSRPAELSCQDVCTAGLAPAMVRAVSTCPSKVCNFVKRTRLPLLIKRLKRYVDADTAAHVVAACARPATSRVERSRGGRRRPSVVELLAWHAEGDFASEQQAQTAHPHGSLARASLWQECPRQMRVLSLLSGQGLMLLQKHALAAQDYTSMCESDVLAPALCALVAAARACPATARVECSRGADDSFRSLNASLACRTCVC